MGHRRSAIIVLWVVCVGLVAAACGSSGESVDTTTATSEAVETATTAATTTTEEAEEPLPAARAAVVRIEPEGSFVDRVDGELSGAWSGSGFIIDESGIAVTNNHVVTGSALLRVYIEGESEPRNARILGVSECRDLAVIDIDGDGYPALEWRTDEVRAGTPVYALGFPLGDSEYTVLDGVISKESADGETSWSSIDTVIEHTADTLPGNSGGPLVDDRARVVGVIYAGIAATGQEFAIDDEAVHQVLDQLMSGDDVESLGINGEAFLDTELNVSGVWVSSVQSGSAADTVGVEEGDVVTRLEGLTLATDGTMSDYCDILRSRNPDDPMSIEVYRAATGETLRGTLNGPPADALEVVALPNPEPGPEPEPDPDGPRYEYETVYDDTGVVWVDIPTEWTDRLGTAVTVDDVEVGFGVSAAPDRQAFLDTWDVPGIFVFASRDLLDEYGTAEAYLADRSTYSEACDDMSEDVYDDGVFVGSYRYWSGCGDTGADFVQLATIPSDNPEYLVYLEFQIVSEADSEALDTALSTFDADI